MSRVPPSQLRRLVATHAHGDLAVRPSFDWFAKSSWFGVRPFKWVSGTMSIGGYRHFSDVDDYSCHLCDESHPMDVASQISMCSRFRDIQERHIAAWPPPFCQVVDAWWGTADRVKRRHFMRTLVPSDLYNRFVEMGWASRNDFKQHFGAALKHRRRILNRLVGDTTEALRAYPLHGPRPEVLAPLRKNR